MKRKKPQSKTVFLEFHSSTFRECLKSWIDAHPYTYWWHSGNEGDETEAYTMSISGWKRFCSDFGFKFKDL